MRINLPLSLLVNRRVSHRRDEPVPVLQVYASYGLIHSRKIGELRSLFPTRRHDLWCLLSWYGVECLSLDITDCFASEIGDSGLEEATFEQYLQKTGEFLETLPSQVRDGKLPFLSLPVRQDDLPEIVDTAAHFRENFDDVIILGTGGSSLGRRTLSALAPLEYPKICGGPRLRFVDNVDPHSFDLMIAATDWSRTGVIAISKSGSTAETMAQFVVLSNTLRTYVTEDRVSDHVVVITEPKAQPARLYSGKHRLQGFGPRSACRR